MLVNLLLGLRNGVERSILTRFHTTVDLTAQLIDARRHTATHGKFGVGIDIGEVHLQSRLVTG